MRNASTQFRFHGEKHDDDTRKKRTRSQNLCRKIRRKAEGSTDKCKTYARTSRRGLWCETYRILLLGSWKKDSASRSISGLGQNSEIKNGQGSFARRIEKFSTNFTNCEILPLDISHNVKYNAFVNSAMANPKKFQIRPHVPS